MGLDMYLTRKIYVGANYNFNKITGTCCLKQDGVKIPIDKNKIKYIEEDAGYWRKANQIHRWFVDNVQDGNDDCNSYSVSIKKLKELLDLCKEVKRIAIVEKSYIRNGERYVDGEWMPIYEEGCVIKNPEEIAKILPTQKGFFFGSSDYDEYYLEDINNTIEIIEKQIKRQEELDANKTFSFLEYQSSW